MPRELRYMFIDDEGRAKVAWDGIQEESVCRVDDDEGPQARWNVSYIIVPPSDYLVTGRPWSLANSYTPINWRETAEL